MIETLIVNDELSLEEKYKLLDKQIRSLLSPEENIISNLANFTAAIKQTFDKVSWVGFYMFDGKKLYLGPFQGKVACTVIEPGKGVCGAAADMKQTIIVEDVNKFEGHIQCDPDSKSEIVIPLIKDNELFGVLDLDSTTIGAFNKTDKKYLEDYCSFLISEII